MMDIHERAEMNALRKRVTTLARQNTRMRAVLTHGVETECSICRIAWCPERERLIGQALGRQRQTLRIPPQ